MFEVSPEIRCCSGVPRRYCCYRAANLKAFYRCQLRMYNVFPYQEWLVNVVKLCHINRRGPVLWDIVYCIYSTCFVQCVSLCVCVHVFLVAIFAYEDFASLCLTFKLKNLKNIHANCVLSVNNVGLRCDEMQKWENFSQSVLLFVVTIYLHCSMVSHKCLLFKQYLQELQMYSHHKLCLAYCNYQKYRRHEFHISILINSTMLLNDARSVSFFV